MEKDLFEDFTTINWVKWSKRKPDFNGNIYMRFNGSSSGLGRVFNGKLLTLDGLDSSVLTKYEETFYWLEEIIHGEAFSDYINNV